VGHIVKQTGWLDFVGDEGDVFLNDHAELGRSIGDMYIAAAIAPR
jgi:hypothetical protein